MRVHRFLHLLAVVAVLTLLSTACSTNSSEGPGDLLSLLAEVPYPDGGMSGSLALRVSAVTALDAGNHRHEACPGDLLQDQPNYVFMCRLLDRSASAAGLWPEALRAEGADADLRQSMGFGLENISTVAQPDGRWSGKGYLAMQVDVSRDDVVAAASADERWNDLLTVTNADGFTMMSWNDRLDLDRRTVLRSFGLGGQLAVSDDLVAVSWHEVGGAIDNVAADGMRIADVPHVRDAVSLLEDQEVLAIALWDQPFEADEPFWDIDPLDASVPGLAPWELLTVGVSVDQGEEIAWIVLSHQTTEAATENVERLQTNFDVLSTLEHPLATGAFLLQDVRAEGTHVVASVVPSAVRDADHMTPFGQVMLQADLQGPLLGIEAS